MENNLSAAVQHMLTTDNILDRIEVSKTIFHLLESSVAGFGDIELAVRKQFIKQVKACAVHCDNGKATTLKHFAAFYDDNYSAFGKKFPCAA